MSFRKTVSCAMMAALGRAALARPFTATVTAAASAAAGYLVWKRMVRHHRRASSATPRLVIGDLVFPEGPRWHEGRLWFSDMHAHEVVAVSPSGVRQTVVKLDEQCSGLGFLPNGKLLVVSMKDRKLLRLDPEAGRVECVVADLSSIATWHCNDMVVDGTGRAYVGNFGFDLHTQGPDGLAPASLALVEPDGGPARAVADGLLFPNGTVVTPDGKTLIVAETFGKRLTAFDIDSRGELSNRRIWARLDCYPDGICYDAEGCVWVANPVPPGSAIRVAAGGRIIETIESDLGVFACMLGGPEGTTLFMLEGRTHDPTATYRGNGRIRAAEVSVPRAGWP